MRLRALLKEQETLFDTIITGLGHELRAPITNISENIKRMGKHTKPDLLENLPRIADYAKTLVDGLSMFADIERPAPAVSDEERVAYPLFGDILYRVENTLRWRAKRKGLKMEISFNHKEFPRGIRLSKEEKEYLYSILFNLLVNAIKYTPARESRPIEVVGEMAGPWAAIRVRNYGIGVLKGDEERIFERQQRGRNAFRGSPTGSGLGLYIARKLAGRLKAELELARHEDPTEFILRLPAKLLLAPWEEVGRRD